MMSSQPDTLRWQFSLARQLADYHLPHLTDAMCLWEPAPNCWTVRKGEDGCWRPDFAEAEPDPPPTVTIGWITWQMIWWWSGALAASRHETPATPAEICWPGSAAATIAQLAACADGWQQFLNNLDESRLEEPFAYPWSEPRPLRVALAWANSELMKNVAEIGILRHQFLAHQPAT